MLSAFVPITETKVQAANINDSSVFLKQVAGVDKGKCTLFSVAMMLRRRAILEGNPNWASITPAAIRSTAWVEGSGLRFSFSYGGMNVNCKWIDRNHKNEVLNALSQHPEGIAIYTTTAVGPYWHTILATDYTDGTVYTADPAWGVASGRIPLTQAYYNGSTQDQRLNNVLQYWYISSGNCNITAPAPTPEPHSHSWTTGYNSAHPHSKYRTCSGCNTKEYTGGYQNIKSCSSCYPLGNAKLTREFNRTSGKTTFYRNNVSNADSYIVNVYQDGSFYDDYKMPDTSRTITLPQGHSYTAEMTVENSNTGQKRTVSCNSFRIYNTYNVSYNANGGKNAPSAQTKIQDEAMTISSSQPTREHYIFKGWASNKTATTAQYQAGSKYTKNAKITLYAVWEPEVYTVNFDANGGKGDLENVSITYGNSMRMPNNIVNTGYYLKGWANTKNATTPDYKIGVDYKPTSNQTLYAVWSSVAWGQEVASEFAGGDGTEENPYQISNAAELAYLASIVNSQTAAPEYKYYKLTDNINLGYNEWIPIGLFGNENQYFTGSFDGNGFTISDLYITQPNEDYIGLFGYVNGSEIKNLTITGAIENVSSANVLNVGGIAGYAGNTNVNGCNAAYFTVSGLSPEINSTYSRVGCMIGRAMGGLISDCTANECSINLKEGNIDAGIIVGNCLADLKHCSVTASENGLFSAVSTIKNVSFGGLCGYLTGSAETCSVSAPYLTNEIQIVNSTNIGGLIGYCPGELKACSVQFKNGKVKTINGEEYGSSIYATTTTNSAFVGGIVGRTETNNAKITDCKYDGQSVTAISTAANAGYGIAGGIAGRMTAKTNPTFTVNNGGVLSPASLPKKDGYTATWYTDSAFTTPYDFSQAVTGNLMLYAKWEKGEDEAIDIWDGTSKQPAYDSSTKTYTVTNGAELAWISNLVNGDLSSDLPIDTTMQGYTVELANDIYLNDTTNWQSWSDTNAPANSWKPIGKNSTNCFKGTFNGNNHEVKGIYINAPSADYQGLFGYADSAAIKNVGVSEDYIQGYWNVGGIVGYLKNGTVNKCYNTGKVSGASYVGGVVGNNYSGNVMNSYNTGTVSDASYVGGVVGRNCAETDNSMVSKCYNTGTVSGRYYVGGVVGRNHDTHGKVWGGIVEESYNTGAVSGTSDVGGVVGYNISIVRECYNIGDVSGGSYVGGVSGENAGSSSDDAYLSNCYATQSTLYYKANSYVSISSVSTKTAAQMKTLSNLSGFSTSTWAVNSNINNGYPYLKSNYSVAVTAVAGDPAISRSFANVDGIVYAESATRGAYAGGILGQAHGTSDQSKSIASGLLAIANNVSAKTSSTSSSYTADSGYIVGWNSNNYFDFTGAYYNSDVLSNGITNTTGTSRPISALKIPSFLTSLVGLNAYQSLDYLKEDETAVWVIRNGELPELYYNCLKDISISEDIENGTITANKTQGIDGEVVEITAVPAEGYVLNKAYVNGEEIVGTTFEISGNSEIYATFIQETPEYTVSLKADENASATLVNADEEGIETLSLMSADDEPVTTLTAADGKEIAVNAVADENYTVDAVYVNGEEIVGDNFILTENTEVTLEVLSLSTETTAVTNDPEFVDSYFAVLSGSVEKGEENVRYISYWKESEPDEIFVTEVEEGGGEYVVSVGELEPKTTYCYQMNDSGEVKNFTTLEEPQDVEGDPNATQKPIETDNPQETETPTETDIPQVTDTPQETEQPAETEEPIILPETMPFEIQNAALNDKVTADIANVSDTAQSGIVIFVAYDNDGKLISVKSQNIDALAASGTLPCEFDIPENADKYKLFIWHSWKHIAPLAESVEVK